MGPHGNTSTPPQPRSFKTFGQGHSTGLEEAAYLRVKLCLPCEFLASQCQRDVAIPAQAAGDKEDSRPSREMRRQTKRHLVLWTCVDVIDIGSLAPIHHQSFKLTTAAPADQTACSLPPTNHLPVGVGLSYTTHAQHSWRVAPSPQKSPSRCPDHKPFRYPHPAFQRPGPVAFQEASRLHRRDHLFTSRLFLHLAAQPVFTSTGGESPLPP